MKIIAATSLFCTTSLLVCGYNTPVFATTTSQAIKLCQKNPSCRSRVGEHSIIMTIGGKEVVECPKLSTGQCIIVRITPSNFVHSGEGGNARSQDLGNAGVSTGDQVGSPDGGGQIQ